MDSAEQAALRAVENLKRQLDAEFQLWARAEIPDTADSRIRMLDLFIDSHSAEYSRLRELQAAAGIDHNGRKIDADGWPAS